MQQRLKPAVQREPSRRTAKEAIAVGADVPLSDFAKEGKGVADERWV
jgi:hypothetical protein